MFTKGIEIDGKHSFADFGLCISKRTIGQPVKNSIRKTIPFMNGFYDFSRINGGDTWGERQISYTFDILGNSPEETDAECTRVLNWLGKVFDADIYDDTIPDYHFHGSFSAASPAESEDGEYIELTITFVCYPFKIANDAKSISVYRGAATREIFGQPIKPTITSQTGGTGYYKPEGAGSNINFAYTAGTTLFPRALPEGEYSLGAIPQNQLVMPWQSTSRTTNGITFTANANGTITANGTATEAAFFYMRGSAELFVPPVGKYQLRGCPSGGGVNSYRMQIYAHYTDETTPIYVYDNGNGGIITITDTMDYLSIAIRIASGVTVDNLVFTPALYAEAKIAWVEEVL